MADYPFRKYQPFLWTKDNDEVDDIYSITRDHGVPGKYVLHNPNDELNDGKEFFEKVLIEYRIQERSYNIFSIADLYTVNYAIDENSSGNIMGDLAERISRRIVKYFLKHFSKHGDTGGIFDKRFNPVRKDDYVVANTERYILKIDRYPNLIILDKTGKGKFGYEVIKELDGLFDYRYLKKRHILVLESKIDKLNIDCESLKNNLFKPLKEIFPEAFFSYIVFSSYKSIFSSNRSGSYRELRSTPYSIWESLWEENIGTLFFTFNESMNDLIRMKNHLIVQYRALENLSIKLSGRMIISDEEIILFDEGETPRIKLIKEEEGMWRECNLYHKPKT